MLMLITKCTQEEIKGNEISLPLDALSLKGEDSTQVGVVCPIVKEVC